MPPAPIRIPMEYIGGCKPTACRSALCLGMRQAPCCVPRSVDPDRCTYHIEPCSIVSLCCKSPLLLLFILPSAVPVVLPFSELPVVKVPLCGLHSDRLLSLSPVHLRSLRGLFSEFPLVLNNIPLSEGTLLFSKFFLLFVYTFSIYAFKIELIFVLKFY